MTTSDEESGIIVPLQRFPGLSGLDTAVHADCGHAGCRDAVLAVLFASLHPGSPQDLVLDRYHKASFVLRATPTALQPATSARIGLLLEQDDHE